MRTHPSSTMLKSLLLGAGLVLLPGCASLPQPTAVAPTPDVANKPAHAESSEGFNPTPLESPKLPYVAPPPDAASPPPGHVVLYTAEAPTAEMSSSPLHAVYAPSNTGRVTFQRIHGAVGELTILPYSICQRAVDFRVYFIVPGHRSAPELKRGDQIRISGYVGKRPEIYRLRLLPAGYYDMGFSLLLQTPHRFIESGQMDDIDGISVGELNISEITADGCVIILPKLSRGDYAVKVGFGTSSFSIPVLFEFSVR